MKKSLKVAEQVNVIFFFWKFVCQQVQDGMDKGETLAGEKLGARGLEFISAMS